ncbi:hypothetical protein [Shewanella sp. Isolate7]|uniref:hypothetical protein n=1 Tax=Shewanella sp. Isolate7 TaxID=2908528 RepID=UPI001EFD601C|nr:hypothetical protein [Shewanella sp. Isolate7]MCG9721945.1 hypothetical protein [Shewanella sp. Isolate7]
MSPVQICSDRLNVKQIRMISDGALAKACTEGGFRSLVRVNNQQGEVRKIGMRDKNCRVKGTNKWEIAHLYSLLFVWLGKMIWHQYK